MPYIAGCTKVMERLPEALKSNGEKVWWKNDIANEETTNGIIVENVVEPKYCRWPHLLFILGNWLCPLLGVCVCVCVCVFVCVCVCVCAYIQSEQATNRQTFTFTFTVFPLEMAFCRALLLGLFLQGLLYISFHLEMFCCC
jgi:hypothetical protein